MKRALILALPLVALAACNKAGDATLNNSNDMAVIDETENVAAVNDMASMPANSSADYLAMAGAGDMFEIESSKAVLETTRNAALKDFANMMVKAHTESTAKVKAAANEAGMTVPAPKLNPAQQTMLDEIKSAQGKDRDTVYMRHQATAHAEALNLHRGYASSGDSAPLKKAAGEIAPVVQQHIDALTKISG